MTSTFLVKPKPERKYYFGYFSTGNGRRSAMKWAEDDGHIVGGIPVLVWQAIEITEEEFQPETTLAELEKRYPLPAEVGLAPPIAPDECNPG